MAAYLLTAVYLYWAPNFFESSFEDSDRAKKYYIISACVLLTLLTGLRSLETGSDTLNYEASYNEIKSTNWSYLIEQLISYLRSGADILNSNSMRDPLYNIFVKFTQLFSGEYRFFMFVIGVIVNVPLGFWVYRYSTDPGITYMTYFVMNFSLYGLTGYRQSIAFSLIVLIGFHYIDERKIVKFLLLLVVAFLFHKTALVVLILYILAKKELTPTYIMGVLVAFVVLFVLRSPFSTLMKSLSGYGEMYTGQYEGAGTWTFTMMLVLVCVVMIIFKDNILEYDKNSGMFMNAILIALIFTPLTFVNPSALRIVEYFSVFLALLMPDMLSILNENSRNLGRGLIFILLAAFMIRSGVGYEFMTF